MPKSRPTIEGAQPAHTRSPATTPRTTRASTPLRTHAQEPVSGTRATTIALVGTHGHGTSHLGHIRRFEARGLVRLVAVADPRPLATRDEAEIAATRGLRLASRDDVGDSTPWYADLDALLAAGRPDIVILCTPISTHAGLAETALRAGCDVLLEKPPTATLAEFEHLLEVERSSGCHVQVGFQSYGSHALPLIRRIVADGQIGEVTGIGGVGTWMRPRTYWTRALWAGRRTLEGRPVVDGVVTNPLAHAVATALVLAGASSASDVAGVELELAHANPIEADDTSCVRVLTTSGLRVALGLTVCAATSTAPHLVVHGTAGRIVLHYSRDVVDITSHGTARTEECGRDDLLENLIAHRVDPLVPLLAPLAATGAFMRVLEAVRTAPAPLAIDATLVDDVTDDQGAHVVVRGVEQLCEQVAETLSTFTELGAPWMGTTR